MENFDEKFESFLAGCNRIVEDYMSAEFPTLPVESIVARKGRKYIKLVKQSEGVDKSAWAFVDKTTGEVLKAGSWASPLSGARGNIFDQANGLSNIGPYGPSYKRNMK